MDMSPLLEPEKSPELSRIEHIPPIAKPLKEKEKSFPKSPGQGYLRGGFSRNTLPRISKDLEFGGHMLRRSC
jgi:hypothetical protein